MPSNISSTDGLWSTARDLSLRKQRKSRGAPMKERLSNFSSDSEDVAQSPPQEETAVSKKAAKSQLTKALAQDIPKTPDQTGEISSLDTTPSSPPATAAPNAKQKRTLFGRKTSSTTKDKSLDVFKFEGEGSQFKGKLIGIKDVEAARGDEMCQKAMQELKASLKLSKEHKIRINIAVSLTGLKIKDEKNSIAMHHHAIPKISYIWRDQTDPRSFGYVYGTPDSGHRFAAIKIADKSADTLVSSIHQLFQVAYGLKQREVEMAKKGQDDTTSNASDDSKKENLPEANANKHHKVDEANLLDLESELLNLSQGLKQMQSMQLTPSAGSDNQAAWADFGGADHISSASSSSSSSDPWGRGSTPQSLRTITPDPFDTMVQYQGQVVVPPTALPRPIAQFATSPPNSSRFSPAVPGSGFGGVSSSVESANPFAAFHSSAFDGETIVFGPPGVQALPELDGAFSVFDPPPVPPPPKEEKKPVIDPFNSFNDILDFGKARTEKTSKYDFPQPIKPTISDIRGEPTVIIPARTTVDPFFITPSSMGLSVSVSPPNHTPMMENFGGHILVPQRRISNTNAVFGAGLSGSGSGSPPSLPPRPGMAHSNSATAFPALAPPPLAPRRSATMVPIPGVGGFSGGISSNPFNSMSSQPVDPFADHFFASR